MTYGYARVSTQEQNETRQLIALQNSGIEIHRIFVDKASGKDFMRPKYQEMRTLLKKGDFLIVQSLDRFGRSYDDIIDEWRYLVKTVGVDIRVLDMPLLDTKAGDGLVGKFVGDIVLQILSFVAEMERRKIKERQAQGIAIAKANGVKFGRPMTDVPPNLDEYIELYKSHVLSLRQAADKLGMARATFYRHATGLYKNRPAPPKKLDTTVFKPAQRPKLEKVEEKKPVDDGRPRPGKKPTVEWVMSLPPSERRQYAKDWTQDERLEAQRIEMKRIKGGYD